ncbi:hypothetical protein NKR23_g8147 [Pleurostoma richardsiae]|uniref:Uncharacterized protein n=1 Tax=Pleurostoma richardsiae TaxID=41990 RepID=A0AA38RGA3_9PEZI|nr:hypothetical protein NKR23_g8147 [Pleurostoma richardsiae]
MKFSTLPFLTTLFPAAALGAGLLTQECYCGESCQSYEWDSGFSWSNGDCFNFNGAAAYAINTPNVYCQIFNGANCQGSQVDTSGCSADANNFYCCWNSGIGWLYSAICYD